MMEFVKAFDWSAYATVLAYLPLCMLGLAIHFLKKKIKTENFHDVRAYFTSHRVSTLTSILSAVVLLYIFDAMGQLNVVSAIMAGYATDSLFQKQVDAMVMRDPSGRGLDPSKGGINSPPTGPRPLPPSGIPTAGIDEPEEGA